jgi:hypothetical protein
VTFTDDLHSAVAALARLAVHGSDHLTEGELDLALIGRAAVLDLLGTVHRDLTGIKPRRGRLTAADIQAHPVAALAAVLQHHPRPRPDRAPSEALTQAVLSPPGQAWRDVARHGILADHAWTTGPPMTRDGEQAWAGIADVAAIAAVLVDLDADLAQAAARLPGRRTVADALAQGASAGLALAARETAALAAAGPLPPQGAQPTPSGNRVVVRAMDPRTVVAAQHQLSALLRTAEHLHPERLQLITIGHLRAVTSLAAALEAGGDDARLLADELKHHARLLRGAAARRGLAASVYGSDPLPVRQAAELYQALHQPRDAIGRIAADPALSRDFAAALADTTRALADTADRHLAGGTWLVQVEVDEAVTWQPSTSWHAIPPPFQALRAAAVHAAHLVPALSVAEPAAAQRPGPGPAPRQALAPAPFIALRSARRPPSPAIPPLPVAARSPAPVRRPLRR